MDKNKIEELKRHIGTAFKHLEKIPVSHVYVDYMAIARQELAAINDILNKEESEEKDNGKSDPKADK